MIFEDVDEFPSLSQLEALRQLPPRDEIVTVPATMTGRKANWAVQRKSKGWRSVKAIRGSTRMRNSQSHPVADEVPGERGVHLSCLGMDVDLLRDKSRQYGHQELNEPSLWTGEYMTFCDRFGVDHLGLAASRSFGLLKKIPDSSLSEIAREVVGFAPSWKGTAFSGPNFIGLRALRLRC